MTAALTRNGRAMLAALRAAPAGSATPAEIIAADPQRWAGIEIRSATASLHLAGAHLARLGMVKLGRRQIDRHGDGVMSGGPRLYRLTAAGRAALARQETRS